ncbi:MAG: hypothetical protein E2P06_00775 [Acidobacteria bacterium]|nr:MAG: hypothetical protein E2P06_00775 [Acidobacteriota bacterium]
MKRFRLVTGSRVRFRIPSASRHLLAAALALVLFMTPTSAGAGRGADGKFEKRESSHFVLFQDVDIDQSSGLRGSRRFEQQVLAELERAYQALDGLLGLRPPHKIQVVIYDPGIFDAQFAGLFRFQAAGFYHGVVRIRGFTQVTVQLARVLHHELAHAAFDAAAPSLVLPAWLNEGVAEWFGARADGKRHLDRRQLSILGYAAQQQQLLPLSVLSAASFSGMGPGAATLAYLQSYGMIEYLARNYGDGSIRKFCLAVVRSRDIERSLRRTFRIGVADLEARFFSEL